MSSSRMQMRSNRLSVYRLVSVCLLIQLAAIQVNLTTALRCDRTPEGYRPEKSPSDGRFMLKISGDPERYTPGERYNGES